MSQEFRPPPQARYTTAEFWEAIGRLENERLEFKVRPSRLAEVLPAMAMTQGGLVVLGIADDRNVVGCPMEQDILDNVSTAARDTGIEVQVREIVVGNHRVTVIIVPDIRGRIVTTPDGRLLRRLGGSNQPLVGDAMARFVKARTGSPAEDESPLVLDFDDLDLDLINKALAGDDRPPVRRAQIPMALADLDLVRREVGTDPYFTNAAVLLFARDPRKYLPAASLQMVRRAGTGPGPGPTRSRKELFGPIPKLVDDALAFIARNTGRHEVVAGAHREVLPEYPVEVLREALLNALGHRDYGLAGSTIDVTIWDDRVEIRSPGSLPGHISLDNIREEHFSRNRRIMRALKLLDLVEEYGDGVDRMFREMETRLMEPPAFAVTPTSVTVTLRNRSLLSVDDQAWLAVLGHLDLSPIERRALVLARHELGLTPRGLRAQLPETDVDSLLAATVAKGLLVRVGRRGGARYVLSDEVLVRAGAAGIEARQRQRQLLLDELRRRGSLSTSEAAAALGIDRSFARNLLNSLVAAKAAVRRGRTRAQRFHAS